MLIPREILDVGRPVNTVVIAYGRDKHLYNRKHAPHTFYCIE